MTISVCLASYNGAQYISAQVRSILNDLGPDDELIVVDDASTDETVEVLNRIKDMRLKTYTRNVNRGHVDTFEECLRYARGEYVALSDQDDLWPKGRTQILMDHLQGHELAVGCYTILNNESSGITLEAKHSGQGVRNIIALLLGRRPYFGSCMMMTAELKERILPFPRGVEAHDHWIAIAANTIGSVNHVPSPPVTIRREHSGNLTPRSRRPVDKLIATRINQTRLIYTASKR